MQTTLALQPALAVALDAAFNAAHDLAISLGNDVLTLDQVGESLILMASPTKPTPIYIDVFDSLNGPLLFASFEHGDWTPEYFAGQWADGGQHMPAELAERWHELAAFAAAVVDCAQVQVNAIGKLQALAYV